MLLSVAVSLLSMHFFRLDLKLIIVVQFVKLTDHSMIAVL